MKVKECIQGVKVWYYPGYGRSVRFAGVVDEEPRSIGDTPVTRLRDMEPAYGKWRGSPERSSVPAAALFALELREVEP